MEVEWNFDIRQGNLLKLFVAAFKINFHEFKDFNILNHGWILRFDEFVQKFGHTSGKYS